LKKLLCNKGSGSQPLGLNLFAGDGLALSIDGTLGDDDDVQPLEPIL
jgi:hypothetical protein